MAFAYLLATTGKRQAGQALITRAGQMIITRRFNENSFRSLLSNNRRNPFFFLFLLRQETIFFQLVVLLQQTTDLRQFISEDVCNTDKIRFQKKKKTICYKSSFSLAHGVTCL